MECKTVAEFVPDRSLLPQALSRGEKRIEDILKGSNLKALSQSHNGWPADSEFDEGIQIIWTVCYEKKPM